ncbi:MAG: HD-GYP domain-containing protein [Anaerolineae bacterium]|nr:HD-GYP domain-containing protein [Anaerolineae bacterium]
MDEVLTSPDAIVEMLLYALELRSSEAVGHGYRVAELCVKLGQKFDLSEVELAVLKRGALLHDIGRIGIPDKILNKEESLSDDEWEIVRRHPEFGAKIIRKAPLLADTVQVVAFHHERWDGMGYPAHLQGEVIPLLARICAVAEVYDSLITDQVYRKSFPKLKALTIIEQDSGKAFDPTVVKMLVKILENND